MLVCGKCYSLGVYIAMHLRTAMQYAFRCECGMGVNRKIPLLDQIRKDDFVINPGPNDFQKERREQILKERNLV